MSKQRRWLHPKILGPLFIGLFGILPAAQADTAPAQAVSNYMEALRSTPEALSSCRTLTGTSLPASGPLTPAQVDTINFQLYDSHGARTPAYEHPQAAVVTLNAGARRLTY